MVTPRTKKGGANRTPSETRRSVDAIAMAAEDTPDLKVGTRLRLRVIKPRRRKKDARASYRGNYLPVDHVGEVETSSLDGLIPQMQVRWHFPASLGYDTAEGTVSTLVHIAGRAFIEARKKCRNVGVAVEIITEEEYQKLLAEAAKQ